MIKIAVYGKGGIGKSTTVSNVAAALAEKGLKVMQIGCDPKADSTMQLRHGEAVPTVLELVNQRKNDFELEDMVRIGFGGVVCVEAGGPTPGMGCAGRGIITALEKLKEHADVRVALLDMILNRRNVKREDEKVAELADDFKTSVVGTLSRSEQVLLAEEQQQILLEAFPDSKMADEYRKLAEQIMAVCEERE